jgi:hypothetical protein
MNDEYTICVLIQTHGVDKDKAWDVASDLGRMADRRLEYLLTEKQESWRTAFPFVANGGVTTVLRSPIITIEAK